MKLVQRWKQTAIHNKALVITSVLMAFGTLFYTAVAIFQFCLIKESGKHTDEQIGRIIDNANWLARSSDYSEKQLENSVFQASQNAQNTISATQQQMRLDERAWVVFRYAGPKPELNKPWELMVHFTNTGKTPAKHVRLRCTAEWSKDETSLKWYRQDFGEPFLLSPNDDQLCQLHPFNPPEAIQADLDAIRDARMTLFVHGAVTYRDVFGSPHWLTFCRRMSTDAELWVNCKSGNDTGDGNNPPYPLGGPPNASPDFSFPVQP